MWLMKNITSPSSCAFKHDHLGRNVQRVQLLHELLCSFTGLWLKFTPLKYEIVSWDDDYIFPTEWKNKSHVPKHQPVFSGTRLFKEHSHKGAPHGIPWLIMFTLSCHSLGFGYSMVMFKHNAVKHIDVLFPLVMNRGARN